MKAVLVTIALIGISTNSLAAPGDGITQSQSEFVLGATQWTLTHEIAHALIAELDINVLGQEEDAADRIASLALLHGTPGHEHGPTDARRIVAAAEVWRLQWLLDQSWQPKIAYWDNHPLDIQRYYNMLCLIHAHDPSLLQEQHSLQLPEQRALICDDYEHENAVRSVKRLLQDYGSDADQNGAKVRVRFVPPEFERQQSLARLVETSGIATHAAAQTSQLFALPRPITIVFDSCYGDATAYWRQDSGEVVICYDLIERFARLHSARSCLSKTGASETERSACAQTAFADSRPKLKPEH